MTSKLFYCKKCGCFLQLRVEIKIFVNYALQRKEKLLLALLTNTYRRGIKEAFHFVSVSLLIEAIQAVNKGNQVIVSLILLQWRIIFNRGPYRKVFFLKINAVL